MAVRAVLLSIPQLRHRDVTPGALSSLEALAARGSMADLIPAFPGLTASAFATLVTGTGPYAHGIVGNAYYDRAGRQVVPSPLPDRELLAPRIWDQFRAVRPGAKVLLWFGPNSEGAEVDLAAWKGGDEGLHTKPGRLASSLIDAAGAFPGLETGTRGEPPRLESTGWILRTAAATIAAEAPDLAIVRVPYPGQVARRFGPDGREAGRAVADLEAVLGPFLASLPADCLVVAATETIATPASDPIYPNQVLRKLGMLAIRPAPGGGIDLDLDQSAAFALADHQVCHVYLNDKGREGAIASAFSGTYADGIAHVAAGGDRAGLGLDHERAGDLVLIACADRWFAPHWWKTGEEAPHEPGRACGLAQASPEGLVDPARVLGSIGAPPPNDQYHGIVVASDAMFLGTTTRLHSRDVAPRLLAYLAGDAEADATGA